MSGSEREHPLHDSSLCLILAVSFPVPIDAKFTAASCQAGDCQPLLIDEEQRKK